MAVLDPQTLTTPSAGMAALCERQSLIRNDTTALMNDIITEMNAETPSIRKLIFLKKRLSEKHAILKHLDSEIEELIDLDNLTAEYEIALEIEDSILRTKFRMDRLFPELQKHSFNDVLAIATKKQEDVSNNDSAGQNSNLSMKKNNSMTPLKRVHQEAPIM